MNTRHPREPRHGSAETCRARAAAGADVRMRQRADRPCARRGRRAIVDSRHHQLSAGLREAARARGQHGQEGQGSHPRRHRRPRPDHLDHRQRSLCARHRERRRARKPTSPPPSPWARARCATSTSRRTARKVVFSLRLPLNPKLKNDDPKQPNWKIYEYDAKAKTVTQLTNDDVTAATTSAPHYLPDGRIVFSSTRQVATQAILLDEGRPQYQAVTDQPAAADLPAARHECATAAACIRSASTPITISRPRCCANGQIVFSRWEVANGADQISLYVPIPTARACELYYGANSHATGANIAGTNNNVIQFLGARQRSDGKLLAIARPVHGHAARRRHRRRSTPSSSSRSIRRARRPCVTTARSDRARPRSA